MRCVGETEVEFKLNNKSFKYVCYICDDSGVIVGVDCIRDRDLVIQPSKNTVLIDSHSAPSVDVKGLVLHHRVVLATTVHLRHGEQRLLLGNVIGKADVDGRPVVVEPSKTVYGKTGAVVCKIAAKPRRCVVPLRIANPGDATITIYKGTTVGILSDVTESHKAVET